MASHLTPDQLHDLWTELQVELTRLGGRFVVPGEDGAPARLAGTRAGAQHTRIPPPATARPPDVSTAVAAARKSGAPERVLRLLEALSRMRLGSYGICVACRGPIPYERLMAIPETTTCIACSRGRAAAGS